MVYVEIWDSNPEKVLKVLENLEHKHNLITIDTNHELKRSVLYIDRNACVLEEDLLNIEFYKNPVNRTEEFFTNPNSFSVKVDNAWEYKQVFPLTSKGITTFLSVGMKIHFY